MRNRWACRLPFISLMTLCLAGLVSSEARPADKDTAVLGKRVGGGGLLVFRAAKDADWTIVQDKAEVPASGLIVGGGGARLDTVDGTVRLDLTGDLNRQSPFPIIETAVSPHPKSRGIDLDFTLERGRVDVTNLKTKGSATVRVHLRDKTGEFTLAEPGASVAIEVYGRWPKGVPFTRTPKPGDGPPLSVAILVLKGKVFVNTPRQAFEMEAPPGRALLLGDSLNEANATPQPIDKLPSWASKELTEDGRKVADRLQRFSDLALAKGVGAALDTFAASDDEHERRAAVLFMAALDDMARLRNTLLHTKHADIWDTGVVAMRNWIGRGPGQDMRLYEIFTGVGKVPEREAEIALNLLHSFGDDELARPETYQFLIGLLNSNRPLLRGLAYWHLARLVPEGKTIGYDLLSDPEARAKAVARWRELVPPGELPKKALSRQP